ncbi:Thimet oligopeptidase [Minicystis rosea]|nr:Thimet oligopeptidase [Minicystis rosea]
MPRSSYLVALLPVLALACGPAAPEPQTPGEPPAPSAGAAATPAPSGADPVVTDADPVGTTISVEGMKRTCDDHLKAAQDLIDRIKSLKGAPAEKLTYDATLGRMDQVALRLAEGGQLPYLMAVAHPDTAVREAAKLCEPKTDKFNTALYLDADLAAVLRAYAAKNEPLEGERKRLLADVLRDFRRNGLALPPEKQKDLRRLNDEIVKLGQEFESNIASARGTLEIRPAQLEGLPPEYKAKHPPNKNGKVEITTDYPDYFPFVTYAVDRKAALDLYISFTNRGGQENVTVLERLLALRQEKAKLLGYATWADYAIEPRMAKSAQAVRGFLSEVRDAVKEPAKVELAELMRHHATAGGKASDKLAPPDRYYLMDRVRAEKFKFDSKEIANYFEVTAVTRGLLDITAKMYGIEYKEITTPAWHADVKTYEVWANGKAFGKFYLDLYSRPDKYKHAAMFPIRTPAKLADGRYLTPIAALECNFPKPGSAPALMSHEDVVTFFHEFGHVLHHLLTRGELASYSGTNTVRDFVEAPSQMFEEWAWSREVLDLFAKHHKTGAKIPDDLFKAMKAARGFGRALDTQRQLFLATLDQELHTRPAGFDSTRVVQEVQEAVDSFGYVKGTHFQSSFGHLIGYDAGYYSYQWALSLSRDVLTRFKKEGLLNPATAAAWRDQVLSRGGGTDERAMVKAFLGREPSNEAYFAFIKGRE